MVRLGCVNDDCDAEPVEFHFEESDVDLGKVSIQCGCGLPRVPVNDGDGPGNNIEPKQKARLFASWFNYPDEYDYLTAF
jgi:hypothetical protein